MKAICGHASEWNNHLIRPAVGKCRGMYERRALLLCSPCSVATYYDYDYWDVLSNILTVFKKNMTIDE